MSAVSETIVREFFELQGYFLRQQRKFVGREDDEIDFLVWPAGGATAASTILRTSSLRTLGVKVAMK